MGTAVALAVAMPVMEFVCPGAPVTIETPGVRVRRLQPSAMCTAADSWRVSYTDIPSRAAVLSTSLRWSPTSVKMFSTPWLRRLRTNSSDPVGMT